jgi:hypothetical protein
MLRNDSACFGIVNNVKIYLERDLSPITQATTVSACDSGDLDRSCGKIIIKRYVITVSIYIFISI